MPDEPTPTPERPERPEWVPEELWDGEKNAVRPDAAAFVDMKGGKLRIKELIKSRNDLKSGYDKLSAERKPPKEYKIVIPEGTNAPTWFDPEHPIAKGVLETAKDRKWSQDDLDSVVATYLAAAEASLPYEKEKLAKLGGMDAAATDARLAKLSEQIRIAAGDDRETHDTMRAWASTARGVMLLEDALSGKLAARVRGPSKVPTDGGSTADREPTMADLVALKKSKPYLDRDQATLEKADRMAEKIAAARRK